MAVISASPSFTHLNYSPAGAVEDVPSLFRSILALVADAERAGLREEAARARSEAIAAYARGWDETSQRRLERIAGRISRRLASPNSRRFFLRFG